MVEERIWKARRILPVMVAMILFITIFAIMDWWVIQGMYHNQEGNVKDIWLHYILWMNISTVTMGVVGATAFWAGSQTFFAKRVAQGIFLSSIIIMVSGLEDTLYFLLGSGGFPSENKQWTWMFQHFLFGNWTTSSHLTWMFIWLLAVLPVLWLFLIISLRKYQIRVISELR